MIIQMGLNNTNSIFAGFHLSGEVSPGEGSVGSPGDQERMKVSVSFDRSASPATNES